MKITKRRQTNEYTRYVREFDRIGDTGSGYWFDCNEHGEIDEGSLTDTLKESLRLAQDTSRYVDHGVRILENRYTSPAEGICECGNTVVLDRFTNPCDCGRDYNMSGEDLAPREQWGEETGEHWADVANI